MLNKKIILIVISAVLALTVAGAGIFLFISNQNNDKSDSDDKENTTLAPAGSDSTNDVNIGGDNSQSESLNKLILGKWRDGADMSGYEFKENGIVGITYINLDLSEIGVSVNETYDGVYTLDGNRLTITTSIYTGTIANTYEASVSGDVLTLVSTEDGDISTYMRSTDTDTDSGTDVTEPSQPQTEQPDGIDLAGSWNSDDGSVKYTFKADGTVIFTRNGSDFSGVYITDKDEVSIQYTSGSDKVTEKFEYRVSDNLLCLENIDGRYVLTRSGTAPSGNISDDLLGKWSDGSGMSGYEFKDGGIVDITYVNITLPVINIPINGTYKGSYSVSGEKITISASIYGATISNTYTYSIRGNVLTLTADDGNVSTYIKK